MSVIISRALPDVRDGLKPVHRRILYAMKQEGLLPSRALLEVRRRRRRGAEALPPARRLGGLRRDGAHGAGLLAALPADRRPGQLRLDRRRPARRLPLHRGRLARIAEELLRDIDRETVDFQPNFDGSTRSRSCCRRGFPNLLANGSAGHRRRHGDQRPAAQPARADRRAGPRGDATRTARSTS